VNQKALELQRVGARKEDVAQGEAQLQAARHSSRCCSSSSRMPICWHRSMPWCARALSSRRDGIAAEDRVYTGYHQSEMGARVCREPDLGSVREGMQATVTVDAFKDRSFPAGSASSHRS